MEAEEKAESQAQGDGDRRIMPRCAVDEEAVLLLVERNARLKCRVVELSLSGCRISTRERMPAGSHVRVEVSFKIRGIAFRFGGVTEWTNGASLIGIQFVGMIPRRMDELMEVLCELQAAIDAKAEKEAAEATTEQERAAAVVQAATGQSEAVTPVEQPIGSQPEIELKEPEPWLVFDPDPVTPISESISSAGSSAVESQRISPPSIKAAVKPPVVRGKRERRTQSRHEVDTSAVILLINVGSQLTGRIVDMSAGGCRIRTDERFPVGIYTRVETEFRLEGLPIRLGGVIQAIQDRERFLVGIRFLDLSARKREQVEQLMEEIEENEREMRPSNSGAN
jgi:c-di-GMP-binding flagellar brake protein YcgR